MVGRSLLISAALIGMLSAAALAADREPAAANPEGTSASERPAAAVDSAAGSGWEANRLHQETDGSLRYLMLGYGLVWLGLGFYLFSLGGRVGRVGREIEELRKRLEDATRSSA